MTRHQHDQRVWRKFGPFGQCVQQQLLFTLARAGGQEDRPLSNSLAQEIRVPGSLRLNGNVELQIA